MSSLKEIKTRIGSVKNTLKITSAMKMVASAKLHKAQSAIGNKLPYEQKLHRILAGLLQSDDLRDALRKEFGFGGKGGRAPVVLQDVSVDELPSKENVGRIALVVFSSNSFCFASSSTKRCALAATCFFTSSASFKPCCKQSTSLKSQSK